MQERVTGMGWVIQQHYYWAESSNEEAKMQRLVKQIEKFDGELQELKNQYELVKMGKSVPLKSI